MPRPFHCRQSARFAHFMNGYNEVGGLMNSLVCTAELPEISWTAVRRGTEARGTYGSVFSSSIVPLATPDQKVMRASCISTSQAPRVSRSPGFGLTIPIST